MDQGHESIPLSSRIALLIVHIDLHTELIAVSKGFDFQIEFSLLGSNPRWIDDLTSIYLQ